MKGANVLSSVLVSVIVADSNDNEPQFDFEVSSKQLTYCSPLFRKRKRIEEGVCSGLLV